MTSPTETIQFNATAETKRRFEQEAAQLNLSLSAYFLYLATRKSLPSSESSRLDRMVKEVFGRHGELMRRLAQ